MMLLNILHLHLNLYPVVDYSLDVYCFYLLLGKATEKSLCQKAILAWEKCDIWTMCHTEKQNLHCIALLSHYLFRDNQ